MDRSSPSGSLLAKSDRLLDRIELLRLEGTRRLPTDLRDELAKIEQTVRGSGDGAPPVTVAGAHHFVFGLQSMLMPTEHAVSAVRPELAERGKSGDMQLRRLALPAREHLPNEETWVELIGLTVQRAHDRWSLLAAQATRADRLAAGQTEQLARGRSALADAALENYHQLRAHAERLLGKAPEIEPVPSIPTSGSLRDGDLVIELGSGPVRRRGLEIPLTPMEKQILTALSANPGRALSRDLLLGMTHGDDPWVDLESRVVAVHVARLRQKLGNPTRIVTVPGIGYRWDSAHCGHTLDPHVAIARRRVALPDPSREPHTQRAPQLPIGARERGLAR